MSEKSEKLVLFDDSGNPKEIRYYEEDKLCARLGVILDKDSNFIGLRELSVEEVIPLSWIQKLGFRKPQPKRIEITTIDFIGLINWINTIKTIKTIENIENIKNIESVDLIDQITKIGEITNIQNVNVGLGLTNVGQIYNGNFEKYYGSTTINHLIGWIDYGICTKTVTECFSGFRGITMKKYTLVPTYNGIFQTIEPSIPTDNIANFTIMWENLDVDDGTFKIELTYSDGSKTTQTITATFLTNWTSTTLTYSAGKFITAIRIYTDHNAFLAFDKLYLDALSLRYKENVNIMTPDGTNILIDLLKQSACLSRIGTYSNDNGVTTPTAPPRTDTGLAYRGKYFPRGMRGFLHTFSIYCKHTASGTITLSYSPQPNMGALGSVTITPSSNWDWKSAYVRKFWNYDSLFIWISACSTDVSWGFDATTPYDMLYSSDAGATWIEYEARPFMRSSIWAQTVGDLPISGTINTIEIPSVSDEYIFFASTVGISETTLKQVFGSGHLKYLTFKIGAGSGSENTYLKIYCDGITSFWQSFYDLNDYGHTASSPDISLLKYAVNGICVLHLGVDFSFKRHLKISAYTQLQNIAGVLRGLVNLQR